ncbi:FxLYD domain-containing protein [Mesorhizobium sp. M0816]|uniref:FxLYD domain-containing protein n=1 Tax=Mesorhizobium sp. M0816 TaxID=2957006 RepID=UPI0033395006
MAAPVSPILVQMPNKPPARSAVGQIFAFLTADWTRVTAIIVIAIIALPVITFRISESLKSPEQKAAEAAKFQQMLAEVRAKSAKENEAEAKAKSEAERIAARPDLKIDGSRCGTEYGFIKITGRVTNKTTRPIENLMAVGIFSSNGDYVKSATAMVEYQPLLPGQTSPYTVMTTANPAITNCLTTFKTMFGGEVSSDH